MKTRRIHPQPEECTEIVNQYGTSMLKAITRFDGDKPVVVIYEQPGVVIINASDREITTLSFEPETLGFPAIASDLTEQNGLPLDLIDDRASVAT
jgi:hypothetical protein